MLSAAQGDMQHVDVQEETDQITIWTNGILILPL